VVTPRCYGRATLIRFAEDFLVLFEQQAEADRFYRALPARPGKFGLRLSDQKTRLVLFGPVSRRYSTDR
jgi:RNA-directed DNA polymerase